MTSKEIFKQNGFILFRKCFDPSISQEVAKEWVNFHANPSETLVSKEEPVVVFWSHVPGERKKMRPISEFPSVKSMVNFKPIVDIVRELIDNQTLQILETIIFSKPPLISNRLGWHQDRSYFPFDKDQIAVWTPLDRVTANSGALQYVPRSHNNGLMGSTDLHTGQPFKDEDRKIIPKDPWKLGYEVVTLDMEPGDIVIHSGQTWHSSPANKQAGMQRRGLSLRYLVGETRYAPRSGSAATFLEQIEVKPGDLIQGPAFPYV